MSDAYFVKVNKDTTWKSALKSIQKQIDNKHKKLKYKTIAEVFLNELDFNGLMAKICKAHPAYEKWASLSIANNDSTWNCITIKCNTDSRSIVIYTAGRTFPLYVSVSPIGLEE